MMIIDPDLLESASGPVYEPLLLTWWNRASGSMPTHTYVGMNIGAAASDRWVIAGIYENFNAGRSISSVTIGGVSATLMYASPTLSASGARLEFWKANVPTGTSVNVVVTSAGTMYDGTCGVWVCYEEPKFYAGGIDATVSSGAFSLAIDIPEGGAVIAMSNNNAGGTTVSSVVGVTQDFNDTVMRIFGGSEDMLPAETGRTIGLTWNTASPNADFDGLGAMSVYF